MTVATEYLGLAIFNPILSTLTNPFRGEALEVFQIPEGLILDKVLIGT